ASIRTRRGTDLVSGRGRRGGAPGRSVDPGLPALRPGDGRGRACQRVVAGAGLGEGDDVADRVGAAEECADPVPSEGDPAVRRRAVLEGPQQEAELLLRLLLGEPHDAEDALLDVLAVDTDRAATDLVAVADDVVGVGQRAARVGVEGVDALGLG